MRPETESSKLKRAHNREGSAKILEENGIPFTTKNDGAHLLLDMKDFVVDFWPGTGLWHVRSHSGQYKGRGVFPLVRYIRKRAPWLESPQQKQDQIEKEMTKAEQILTGQSTLPPSSS